MKLSRNELLSMCDEALSKHCRCECFRSTGPGGQHRNTTDSAVRLTLKETHISAIGTSSRSQHRNKAEALKKLRIEIAFALRDEMDFAWKGPWKIGKNDRRYPLFIARLFDTLSCTGYRVAETANDLNISTGKFIRILASDPQVWKVVNERRVQRGLKVLKN